MNWAVKELGPPRWWLPIMCNKETAGIAWRKANEGAEEVSEEGAQEIADGGATFETEKAEMAKALQDGGYNMTKYETLNVDKSAESVASDIKALFCAKIVLVNHDPRLAVDIPCANLAIKFNMVYISVHQLIRQNITNGTPMGKALLKSRSQRSLSTAFHRVS